METVQVTEPLQAAKKALKVKDYAKAKEFLVRILRVDPENALALKQLTKIEKEEQRILDRLVDLLRQGDFDKAETIGLANLRRHDSFPFYNFMAGLYLRRGKLDLAKELYHETVKRSGYHPKVFINLGIVYRHLGDLDEAIRCFKEVERRNPEEINAKYGLAFAYLLQGNYTEGWKYYESRWNADFSTSVPRNFPKPPWDGSPLDGRTLLVYCEQGHGDSIQFSRVLDNLKGFGGRIVFECQPALKNLFSKTDVVDEVVGRGQPLPDFDVHVPLLSLPYILGLDAADLAGSEPYVFADRVADLGDAAAGRLKVGIVWKGSDTFRHNKFRSMHFEDVSPLLDVDGCAFHSLQVLPGRDEVGRILAGSDIVDLGSTFSDYIDTANVIAALDLVITVDTSVAHLAGAMGRKTWVLLHFMPDFRWMLERSDSPWYPSIELFRQKELGNWREVIGRVKERLEKEAAGHGAPG